MQDKTRQLAALHDSYANRGKRRIFLSDMRPFMDPMQERLLLPAIRARTIKTLSRRDCAPMEKLSRVTKESMGLAKECAENPELWDALRSRFKVSIEGNVVDVEFKPDFITQIASLIYELHYLLPRYGVYVHGDNEAAGIILDRHMPAYDIGGISVHFMVPLVAKYPMGIGEYTGDPKIGKMISINLLEAVKGSSRLAGSYPFTQEANAVLARFLIDNPPSVSRMARAGFQATEALRCISGEVLLESVSDDSPKVAFLELMNRLIRCALVHEATHLYDHSMGRWGAFGSDTHAMSELKAYLFQMAYADPLFTYVGLAVRGADTRMPSPNEKAGWMIHDYLSGRFSVGEGRMVDARGILDLRDRLREHPELLSDMAKDMLVERFGQSQMDAFPIDSIRKGNRIGLGMEHWPIIEAMMENGTEADSKG